MVVGLIFTGPLHLSTIVPEALFFASSAGFDYHVIGIEMVPPAILIAHRFGRRRGAVDNGRGQNHPYIFALASPVHRLKPLAAPVARLADYISRTGRA